MVRVAAVGELGIAGAAEMLIKIGQEYLSGALTLESLYVRRDALLAEMSGKIVTSRKNKTNGDSVGSASKLP